MRTEQTMRIFCKMDTALNAAVRGDKVRLVPADSSDKSQHWILDNSAVGNLTDDEGGRAFALVNRTTGQAIVVNENEVGELQLAPYSGHVNVELRMLWSLGEQRTDGYSKVRVLRNINYTLNALGGYPIKDGTVVGTYYSQDYDHTLWKIVPVNEE